MVAPGMPNTSSSSASSTMSSTSASTPFDPQQNKVLVLCFDGTTNAFDSTNTNVAKLFQLLDKTDPKKQACFYQPGVGTYTLPSIVTPITSTVTKIIDMGIGWFFASHVTSGYKFIVDNWMPGDKICLFGFSRGAYTARALAGMVEKVGVIPANNDQQLQFAWSMYKEVDKSGEHTKADLARTFKETFSRDVQIDFVGVWDTVGSVGGIIERHYPYTANNRSIKIFRHAISLDERRVKFAQNRYHYKTTSSKGGAADPEGASNPLTTVGASGSLHVLRDTYKADVEEVYFAGCHTDVGGGNQLNETQRQLSNIPLDWMVAQILKTGVGIRFNEPALIAFQQRYNAAFTSVDSAAPASSRTNGSTNGVVIGSLDGRVNANIIPSIDDSLVIKALKDLVVVPFWWMLECFPFKRKYQDHADSEKKWRVSYWPHFGRARTVAPGSKIHDSVRDKMNLAGLRYKPAPQLPSDVEWVST